MRSLTSPAASAERPETPHVVSYEVQGLAPDGAGLRPRASVLVRWPRHRFRPPDAPGPTCCRASRRQGPPVDERRRPSAQAAPAGKMPAAR